MQKRAKPSFSWKTIGRKIGLIGLRLVIALVLLLIIGMIVVVGLYKTIIGALAGAGVLILIIGTLLKQFWDVLNKILTFPRLIALLIVLVGIGVSQWKFLASINSDQQGLPDLWEALAGMNPYVPLQLGKQIEEECWRKMEQNVKLSERDEDHDGFTPECGDPSDADPSLTPRPLLHSQDEYDSIPNRYTGALLIKGRPFMAPSPHLGEDSIVEVRVYITGKFLSDEDGAEQTYHETCPPRYDHGKIVCDLTEKINDWRQDISVGNISERPLLWRMKFTSQKGITGYVQNDWVPFTASFK